METCRLSASHVRLGVPLPGDIYGDAGQMLLSKGYVIDSQAQLDALLSRGMYVDITTFESHFKSSAAGSPPPVEKKFDPFHVRNALKVRLNRLLRGVLDGGATAAQLLELAADLETFADADPEAAIAACLLDRQEDAHAVGHSLRTATLGALLARRLEWSEARRRSTVGAALTMNLGMLDLQQRLLRQATPLAPAQLAQVQAHPEAAAVALQQLGIDDPVWLDAVRQHHERPGGAGYPQHLCAPCAEAQLLHLGDVFGARTNARADRPALPSAQALRALFVEEEGQGVASALVGALVKMLGIHPPGSFVRLANQEIGVVFRHAAGDNALVVAAVTTSSGMPTMQPVRRDTRRKEYAIATAIGADKVSVGYDLGPLWVTRVRG